MRCTRLNGSEGGWQRNHAADEYDRYMRRVAEGLQTGEEETSVVNYPVGIETAHMGISPTSESRSNRRRRPKAVNGTKPADQHIDDRHQTGMDRGLYVAD